MQEEGKTTGPTWAQVRAELAAFEAQHPGLNSSNFHEAFLDEDGALVPSPEFQRIESFYSALEVEPSSPPRPGAGFVTG